MNEKRSMYRGSSHRNTDLLHQYLLYLKQGPDVALIVPDQSNLCFGQRDNIHCAGCCHEKDCASHGEASGFSAL